MYSVPMALVDLIPVLLFGAAALLLQRDLYTRLSKGAYALFCAGAIDVFMAGFLKAVYKLLYAAGVCDFERLNQLFFPLQALGFVMAGIALFTALIVHRGKNRMAAVAAPAVFSGTPVFVTLMVLGLLGMDAALIAEAHKRRQPLTIVLLVVSFVFSLAMGYLSSKDFSQSWMNWIAELVNCIGQGALLAGVWMLHKAGLAEAK